MTYGLYGRSFVQTLPGVHWDNFRNSVSHTSWLPVPVGMGFFLSKLEDLRHDKTGMLNLRCWGISLEVL